jgi:hypothetical protein
MGSAAEYRLAGVRVVRIHQGDSFNKSGRAPDAGTDLISQKTRTRQARDLAGAKSVL